MIVFRHADPRFPFLWEIAEQSAARWHGDHEGPAHYFADTPDGAWAEFLRHGVENQSDQYDFSCMPDDTRWTADRIPGARLTIMTEIGHFAKCILPVLDEIRLPTR